VITPEVKPEVKQVAEPKEDEKALLRAEESAHLALETVGLVMGSKYTDVERSEFFLEHPELANIANRSKKYKDSYRDLIKRRTDGKLEATQVVEKKEIKEPVVKKDENEFIDITEDELVERAVTKMKEENVLISRKKSTRDFAVSQGLNETEFQTLNNVTEAIYKSDPNIEHNIALKSAMVTIGKDIKSTPIKMPTSETSFDTPKPVANPEVEINRIMELTRSSKEVATKIYNSESKIKGDITGEGITIPTDF